jgi:hypothetical protein
MDTGKNMMFEIQTALFVRLDDVVSAKLINECPISAPGRCEAWQVQVHFRHCNYTVTTGRQKKDLAGLTLNALVWEINNLFRGSGGTCRNENIRPNR